MSLRHDPMIWEPREEVDPTALQRFRFKPELTPPHIAWELRENKQAFNRLWTSCLETALKLTEEGAKEIAQLAASVIRNHIANFSKPTIGGKISKLGSFGEHERLDRSGTSLHQSIGWDVDKGDVGGHRALAGVGVGGKEIPLNPDGEPYAGFVERGTAKGTGRYVPKVVDVTLIDLEDPANTLTFKGIPESWAPKMSPDVNVLLEGWWGSRRKRALLKKRSRKMRYLAESWSNALLEKKLAGARKSIEKGRPRYEITGTGRAREWARKRGGPKAGMGVQWYRKRMKTIPGTETTGTDILRDQQGREFMSTWWDEEQEAVHEFVDVMGGKLRGYGGERNILRSVGDISYGYFALDIKFYAMALSGWDPRLLEGMPGVITGEITGERGWGRRRDDGEWPGTPARNYMRNSAVVMARRIRDYVIEARKRKGMVTGRSGDLRMFQEQSVR